MENIQIRRVIEVDAEFTAEQWGLYTTMPGAEYVARDLNHGLGISVKAHGTREGARAAIYLRMHQHREFGALDSEPCAFLEQVLDYIWGHRD